MTDYSEIERGDEPKLDHFSECPGCGRIGHTVEKWVGGVKMMACPTDKDECRVEEYYPQLAE